MRKLLVIPSLLAAALAGAATRIVQDHCGPFTDVSPQICPYVLEMYYLGITAGTSATTYSPDATVTRGQAAVFVSKGVNQALARSSRRAALGQWWTSSTLDAIALTQVLDSPQMIVSDGADLWVAHANGSSTSVSRIRASDGRVVETWTASPGSVGILVAMGRVFVTAQPSDPELLMIDPSQPAGQAKLVTNLLGSLPTGIAFDGARLWTANQGYAPGSQPPSVSIITPSSSLPWPVVTVTTGFSRPYGALFDGTSIWITDGGFEPVGALRRLNPDGSIAQSVPVGKTPLLPVYDGANIWVPNAGDSTITVVRASDGVVLATLGGNGLSVPFATAFDGERILVTNAGSASVSLWRASDLTAIGTFATPENPFAACSDGKDFWITFDTFPAHVGRF